MVEMDIDGLLSQLTTDEKLSLLAGGSTWRTAPIKRLGIPKLKVRSDAFLRQHYNVRTQNDV